jgi:hypothetical protein
MPKRSSNPKPDENQAAFDAVAYLTGQSGKNGKNPAAVALGRLGGKKGGAARAKALSGKRRSEIARKGAKARWKGHERGEG